MSPFLELNLFTMLMFLAVGGLVWFLTAREISSTRGMRDRRRLGKIPRNLF